MEKPTVYLNKRDSRVYGLREPTPVQIICGDCSVRHDEAGEAELLPMRTFLAMDGRCYTCGGRSFVIASELCSNLRRTIAERRQSGFEEEYASGPARGGEAPQPALWIGPESSEGVAAQQSVASRKRGEPEILTNFGLLVN
jgi:hypothetical protein